MSKVSYQSLRTILFSLLYYKTTILCTYSFALFSLPSIISTTSIVFKIVKPLGFTLRSGTGRWGLFLAFRISTRKQKETIWSFLGIGTPVESTAPQVRVKQVGRSYRILFLLTYYFLLVLFSSYLTHSILLTFAHFFFRGSCFQEEEAIDQLHKLKQIVEISNLSSSQRSAPHSLLYSWIFSCIEVFKLQEKPLP